MADLIGFLLSNFTLTLLILGFIAAAISLWRRPSPLTKALVVEDLLAYFVLFSIGISYLYNFVSHVFFGDMAAQFIGWSQSPFQAELGFASLGFSVVGFMAFRGVFVLRVAAVVGPSCFTLGAAGVHVYEMITHNNFEPGNAGVIFFTDIGIPIIGFGLLGFKHRWEHEPSAAEEVSREGATAT
jgi:Family of unknown function (DUF6790)